MKCFINQKKKSSMERSMTGFQKGLAFRLLSWILLHMFRSVVELLHSFLLGLNEKGCPRININENQSTLKFRYPSYFMCLTMNHWQQNLKDMTKDENTDLNFSNVQCFIYIYI